MPPEHISNVTWSLPRWHNSIFLRKEDFKGRIYLFKILWHKKIILHVLANGEQDLNWICLNNLITSNSVLDLIEWGLNKKQNFVI